MNCDAKTSSMIVCFGCYVLRSLLFANNIFLFLIPSLPVSKWILSTKLGNNLVHMIWLLIRLSRVMTLQMGS